MELCVGPVYGYTKTHLRHEDSMSLQSIVINHEGVGIANHAGIKIDEGIYHYGLYNSQAV